MRIEEFYNEHKVLYVIIVILFALIFLWSLVFMDKSRMGDYSVSDEIVTEWVSEYEEPIVIEKTEPILRAESDLEVIRNVSRLEDGRYFISAYVENIEKLDDVILNDFVEEIKFEEKAIVSNGLAEAKNGKLFPPGKKLTVASYGPGPLSEKATNLNVVLLDLNFDGDSEDTALYEITFDLEEDIDQIIFSGAEFRFDKFIIELEEEVVQL